YRDPRRVLRLRPAGQPRRGRHHASGRRATTEGGRGSPVNAGQRLTAEPTETRLTVDGHPDRRLIARPTARPVAVLIPLVAAAAALSLWVGRTSGGPAFGLGDAALAETILLEIRVPRMLLALLVGGTLGL